MMRRKIKKRWDWKTDALHYFCIGFMSGVINSLFLCPDNIHRICEKLEIHSAWRKDVQK